MDYFNNSRMKTGKSCPGKGGTATAKSNYIRSCKIRKGNCHNCGKRGHYVQDCAEKRKQDSKFCAAKGGTATSKSNSTRSYQFRKGKCYHCGKRGHYVQDCAAKREKQNSLFNPKQHQENCTKQPSVSGKWTDDYKGSHFMKLYKSCLENARKMLASSESDSLKDRSSSASDSSQDYSCQNYFSSEEYPSPGSECYSSPASEEYPSPASECYSSSASDSCLFYSSSHTDSSEGYSSSVSESYDSDLFSPSNFLDNLQQIYALSSSDDNLLTTKPEPWEHCRRQNGSATASHGHINPVKNILSLDCTQPQTSQLFPMSNSEHSSSFSTIQPVETSTSHGDLGLSKMIHSSTVKLVLQPIGELKGLVPEPLDKSNRILPQPVIELKGCEESQLYHSPTLSISEKALDERQVSIGTGACSLSENIRQVSKEGLDSAEECHKLVHSMHNLSVLLLTNSSSSDHLSESNLQALQSIICNLSECLAKRMNVSTQRMNASTQTHGSAVNPEKHDITANTEKIETGCNTSEEWEDPGRISDKAIQSQMLNIEGELNLMRSEFRCLRMELEMKRLNENHTGAHENGNIETLANKYDIANGSCPEVNLGIEGNAFDDTAAHISQGGSNGLPDLKLNPIMDSQSKTDANFIEKHEGIVLSQNIIFRETILNSSLETSGRNSGQPNTETEIEQTERQFRVLEDQGLKHSDLEDQGINFLENYAEIEKLNPGDNMDFVDMRAYMGNGHDTFLEDGAMVESPTETKSSIFSLDLDNADAMHTLECSESDSSWEQMDFEEEDHI